MSYRALLASWAAKRRAGETGFFFRIVRDEPRHTRFSASSTDSPETQMRRLRLRRMQQQTRM